MAVRKLTPETKTLRYMINGMGMVAGRASTRIGKRSFDLFGFVDVLGFKPRMAWPSSPTFLPDDPGKLIVVENDTATPLLFVQCTSSSNQAARKKKILDSPTLRARAWALINSGHRVEVWGWISGRHAGAQAFRRFELRGATPAGLVWHDKGVTEVEHEIIGELVAVAGPGPGRLTGQH